MYSGEECIDGDRMMIENQFGSNAGCLSLDVGCNLYSASFREIYVDVDNGYECGGSGSGLWRSTEMKNDEEKGKK